MPRGAACVSCRIVVFRDAYAGMPWAPRGWTAACACVRAPRGRCEHVALLLRAWSFSFFVKV